MKMSVIILLPSRLNNTQVINWFLDGAVDPLLAHQHQVGGLPLGYTLPVDKDRKTMKKIW